MIRLTLLILLFLVFFSVSSAIIYHIWRYSPERKSAIVLISIYVTVSVLLIISVVMSYTGIDWKGIF